MICLIRSFFNYRSFTMLGDTTVAIVSHDFGGAEILSSWATRWSATYLLVLGGPAIDIFERNLGPVSITSVEVAIRQADWVLTGTSW